MRVCLVAATIEAGTSSVEITRPKERGLLALLALTPGRVVTVDRLIDGLWGESPPKTAAKTLQTYVKNLRGRFAAIDTDRNTVRTEPPGYLLDVDAAAVDVLQFETLCGQASQEMAAGHPAQADLLFTQALQLVGNGDFVHLDTPGLEGPRRRLIEQHRLARDDQTDMRLLLGQHRQITGPLAELVEREPENERAWAQLMRSLYHSDRQRDALQVFGVARKQLADEFGLDPGPALVELEQQILSHTLPPHTTPIHGSAIEVPGQSADRSERASEGSRPPTPTTHNGIVVRLIRRGDAKAEAAIDLHRVAAAVVDGLGIVEHAETVDGHQIRVHTPTDAALITTRALHRMPGVRVLAHSAGATDDDVAALAAALDASSGRALFEPSIGAEFARHGWQKHPHGWHAPNPAVTAARLPPTLARQLEDNPLRSERDVERQSMPIITSVTSGGRPVVRLTGPMGMGKSHWLGDFAGLASQAGVAILYGRGGRDVSASRSTMVELAYQAVVQLPMLELEHHLARFGDTLAQTLPELGNRVGVAQAPVPALDRDSQGPLITSALLDLIDRFSRTTPVMLLIDNAAELDEASARMIVQLLQDQRTQSIGVVLACRNSHTPGSALDPALEELCVSDAATVELQPFTVDQTARYLDQLARTSRTPRTTVVAKLVHQVTQGLPLFVREVAHELVTSPEWFSADGQWQIDRSAEDLAMPSSIRALLQRRLDRLPAEARELANTAAVLGEAFGSPALAHIIETPLAAVMAATDQLIDERVVEELPGLGGHYRFLHPLLWEVARSQVGPGRQRMIAQAAANYLRQDKNPTGFQLDRLADLSYRALPLADPALVAEHLNRAGSAAAERGDHHQALAHFGRLAELERQQDSARASTLVSIAEMSAIAEVDARVTRARARQAFALATAENDGGITARAALAFVGPFNPFGALVAVDEEAASMATAALELEPTNDRQRARLLGMLAAARSDVNGAAPDLEPAMHAARTADDSVVLGRMLSLRNAVESTAEPVHERLTIDEQIVTIGAQAGDRHLELQGWGWTAAHAFEAGQVPLLEKAAGQRANLANLLDDRVYQWSDRVYQGMRLTIAGRFDEAETMLWRALELGRLPLGEHANRFFGLQLLKLSEMRGQRESILATTEQFTEQLDYVSAYVALAHLCAEMGRLDQANELITQHVPASLDELPDTYDRLPTLGQLARIAQRTGDADLGARVALQLAAVQLAPRPRGPDQSELHHSGLHQSGLPQSGLCVHADAVLYGSVEHNLGRCALAVDDHELALDHLDRSIPVYEDLAAAAWLVLLASDRAAALEGLGQSDAARALAAKTQGRAEDMGLAL